MITIYKYLFYRVYSFVKKLDKDSPSTVAAHGTIILLTFIFVIDINFILRLIERKTVWDYQRFHFFLIIGFVYLANLLIFFRLICYKQIELEFSKESRRAYLISVILTILFLSVAVLPIFIK